MRLWPSALERRIARRYLQGRRRRRGASLQAVIATGGVAIGTMALVVVLGVMNGVRDELQARILVGSPHLRILTYGDGLRVDDWRTALATVRADPDVVAAAPEVLTQSILTTGADYVVAVNIIGLDTDTGRVAVTTLPQAIVEGDLGFRTTLPATGPDGIEGGVLLGRRLAAKINAHVGSTVLLVPPTAAKVSPALGVAVPRMWRFEVTGLFDTGMFQYDDQFLVMPLATAQRFAGLDSAVSGIEVRVRDAERAPAVGARLEETLGYPYRSLDWQTQNASLFGALKLEKLGMGLVIFFIMIVAAFNIVGVLTMVVVDKTREIGILQAMGLPRAAVARIFLAQGAAVGLLGVGSGLGLGLLVAAAIDRWHIIPINPAVYFIDHLPVRIEPRDVLLVVAAGFLLAIGATIYPAREAAGLTPVEAIRHE
ncbi:MAG TPA: ABC transporter permease [Gemmatimonadales bacterium]|jgi:lipoprotein-releasing system permease protein|nr:ABC transporter permease [Gemmatimonadales bacterium]